MKVAVTGVNGRLGGALVRYFSSQGVEVVALDREALDLSKVDRLAERLREIGFDALINPAAVTSLEACEDGPDEATRVNAVAPELMAIECRERAVPFLHVSTDYVFDGAVARPLVETDTAQPISHYGATKLAGEKRVLEACPSAWVARVSWVFGPEKPSFIETMLNRHGQGEALAAIDDKFSCPTFTDDAAVAFHRLIELSASGTGGGLVHVCNPGAVSWHEYAEKVFELAFGEEAPKVERLKLSEMTAFRVPRPQHTAMDPSRLEALTGWAMRPWQEAVRAYLSGFGSCPSKSGKPCRAPKS